MAIIGASMALTGCVSQPHRSQVIAEGVLFSVEYKMENGQTAGFTRLDTPNAVPGKSGSWNVDAYGRLTRDYLIITRPQQPEFGPRLIPASRLVDVQFGDGGIKKVNEGHPASGQ